MAQHGRVGAVNENIRARDILESFVGPHVIEMAVGVDDVNDRQLVLGQCGQNPIGIVAGIDDYGLTGFFTSQNETICLNGAQSHLTNDQISPPCVNR